MPPPRPRCFGSSNTCDHWIAKNELSRGINGETVGLSYRDYATGWVDGHGMKTKQTNTVVSYLRHILDFDEKFEYFWTDGASELQNAAVMLGAAHDRVDPGNKRQNARAERANGFLLDGTRSNLLQAGLPEPYWPYALEYFAFVCNVKNDKT